MLNSRTFIDNNGKAHGFDMDQTKLINTAIAVGWKEVTDTWDGPPLTPAEAQAALVLSATGALHAFNGPAGPVMRCLIAGVPIPSPFRTYHSALCAIIDGTDTTTKTIPTAPLPVAGT